MEEQVKSELVGEAYLRVSSEDRAKTKLGIDAQKRTIEGVARSLGITIRKWHIEKQGIRSNTPYHKRYMLLDAIHGLKEGEHLLVAHLDRLARPEAQSETFQQYITELGIILVTHRGVVGGKNESSADWISRRMEMLLADLERRQTSERTKRALKTKQIRGEALGKAHYGYRKEGRMLVRDEYEQEVLAVIKELDAKGMSRKKIANHLDNSGYKSRAAREGKKNKPWPCDTVRSIIDRMRQTSLC